MTAFSPGQSPPPVRMPTVWATQRSLPCALYAEGGARTHTASRPPDFESGASTSSATSARGHGSCSKKRGGLTRTCLQTAGRVSACLLANIRLGADTPGARGEAAPGRPPCAHRTKHRLEEDI